MTKFKEGEKFVVSTPTQEDYDRLMEAYEKVGWRWCNRVKPKKAKYYEYYADETCIMLNDRVEFCNLNFYKEEGYTVISLDEAIAKLKEMYPKELSNYLVGVELSLADKDTLKDIYKHQADEDHSMYDLIDYSSFCNIPICPPNNNNILTKKPMSITQKLRELVRQEPDKSFIKLGLMDTDGELTRDGAFAFVQFLFENLKEERAKFGKDVEKICKEDKDK